MPSGLGQQQPNAGYFVKGSTSASEKQPREGACPPPAARVQIQQPGRTPLRDRAIEIGRFK